MLFSLKKSPVAFLHYMERCLGDLRDEVSVPYLDDILVFSKDFEQHIENVWKVLQKQMQCGIKLRQNKCDFFRREVCYMGLNMDIACTLGKSDTCNEGEKRGRQSSLRSRTIGREWQKKSVTSKPVVTLPLPLR